MSDNRRQKSIPKWATDPARLTLYIRLCRTASLSTKQLHERLGFQVSSAVSGLRSEVRAKGSSALSPKEIELAQRIVVEWDRRDQSRKIEKLANSEIDALMALFAEGDKP